VSVEWDYGGGHAALDGMYINVVDIGGGHSLYRRWYAALD
jgi:hypothetical protein